LPPREALMSSIEPNNVAPLVRELLDAARYTVAEATQR
jgi:hypothetical protein